MKKTLNILSILSLSLLSACISNPEQGVYFVGDNTEPQSSSSTSTTINSNTVIHNIPSNDFENCKNLSFLRGNSEADSLKEICISRKLNDYSTIKIMKSNNLPSTKSICIITAAKYIESTVPWYIDNIFYIDIDEAICGPYSGGEIQLKRSDYNFIIIVLERDLAFYKEYITEDTDYFPSLAEGRMGTDLSYPEAD